MKRSNKMRISLFMAVPMLLSTLLPGRPTLAAANMQKQLVHKGHTYAFMDAEQYGLDSYRTAQKRLAIWRRSRGDAVTEDLWH